MPDADPNAAARRGDYAGVDMGNNPAAFIAEQQVVLEIRRRELRAQLHFMYNGQRLFLRMDYPCARLSVRPSM